MPSSPADTAWLSRLPVVACAGAVVVLVICLVRSAWEVSLVTVGALVLGGLGVAVGVEMRRVSRIGGWSGRARLHTWATYRLLVSSTLSLVLSAIALAVTF